MLAEVLSVLLADDSTSPRSISKWDVVRWASSSDLETLGAVFALLDKASLRERIVPSLTFSEHQTFILAYLERCLVENPEGEWPDSRYEAGWSLTSWIKTIWADEAVPREKLLEIKTMLARLYKSGDAQIKTCIVNATLEHLFENRSIAAYFADWGRDPSLAQAFSDAMLWSEQGGRKSNHFQSVYAKVVRFNWSLRNDE
jgi:hypothetical protein